MEQDPNIFAPLVERFAEELIIALAVALILGAGAIVVRWFFGRKNLEELGRLRREMDDLKRGRDGRASSPPPASAPAPADVGSNPPDALLPLKELLALVKGHTDIAAEQMLKPYKGRSYHVRGAVLDVCDYSSHVQVSLYRTDGISITLWFDPGSQKETLKALRIGVTVSATGLLHSAGDDHIFLEKCALDSIGAGSP